MKGQKRCAPSDPEYNEMDSSLGAGIGHRTEGGPAGLPSSAHCCTGGCGALDAVMGLLGAPEAMDRYLKITMRRQK